jgi:histidinol phosphatase-like enzyme
MPTKKVVILDRDGVINVDSDAFISRRTNGSHCPVRSKPSRV